MNKVYRDFIIRDWQERDRIDAVNIITAVIIEYQLPWKPEEIVGDVIDVETYYTQTGGEFWVIEKQGKIVGTAAYYPSRRVEKAAEIRKMYLLPEARGQGLGKFLLQELETTIASHGFYYILLETSPLLTEAVKIYESNGYLPSSAIKVEWCDRLYMKQL